MHVPVCTRTCHNAWAVYARTLRSKSESSTYNNLRLVRIEKKKGKVGGYTEEIIAFSRDLSKDKSNEGSMNPFILRSTAYPIEVYCLCGTLA